MYTYIYIVYNIWLYIVVCMLNICISSGEAENHWVKDPSKSTKGY